MNDTHRVLAYADELNLIGDDIRIERNADMSLYLVRNNLSLFSTVLPSSSCCFCPVGL